MGCSRVAGSDGGASDARRSVLPGASWQGSPKDAASPGETVEKWLVRNGQTARLREMLWEPLALALLNQPPSQAAAPAFARVLGEMFGGTRGGGDRACRPSPFTRCTPSPRAHTSSGTGALGAPARRPSIRIDASRGPPPVRLASDGSGRWTASRDCGRALVRDRRSLRRRPVVARPTSRACASDGSSPVVTVNCGSTGHSSTSRSSVCPGRAMQWAFDKRAAFRKRRRVSVVGVERGVVACPSVRMRS